MPISKNILHNGALEIAIGRSRKETSWKNKEMQWSDLLDKLSVTFRTPETYNEYLSFKKPLQDERKDVGGFIGGYLTKGRRKPENVLHRQLITLDIDYAKADMWEDFTIFYGCAACIYSTHKHSPTSPRLRLILPLDRPVMSDEYVAIARRIAGTIGIEDFDHTGFQPSRLMYWPSTSKDGEYLFECQDGPWLEADKILATYTDWRDSSEWPVSERYHALVDRAIKKQGDPLEKPGVVGAFCRTYTIGEVIDKFLSDQYEACDIENRYTYKEGSTAAGLVVYDDKYAYSHHGTDPISGKLCNAFDLVRLHKYGLKDEDAREGTPGNKLPSYTEMTSFATSDREVRKQIGHEKLAEAKSDFDEEFEDTETDKVVEDDEWLAEMDADKKGKYHSTVNNVLLILKNDPKLKGRFAYDLFEHRELATKNLPWRKVTNETRFLTDSDDAGIRCYMEKNWDITGAQKIEDGLDMLMIENAVHPIKDYLNSVEWDGRKRAETLFIDYLGAEDSEYIRAITRKWLVAAVARIFKPGCKFDYMPLLIGEQGLMKSMIADKLGGKWFSDSFYTIQGKEAFEQTQGAWIIEVAELSALKNAEVEATKHFIGKRKDRYRVPFGRRVEEFLRQCVFIGTSNKRRPLKDPTGGRRFWPAMVYDTIPVKNVANDLTQSEIDQIWAEAVHLYGEGEPLFLSKELEEYAKEVQKEHTEQDDRTGMIEQYLETLLPDNWKDLDIYARRAWLQETDELQPAGTVKRDRVCIAEVWCEVLGGHQKEMTRFNTKDIHDIMQKMSGWKPYKGKLRFGMYGVQRGYTRIRSTATFRQSAATDISDLV